jgi:hypothetical protein
MPQEMSLEMLKELYESHIAYVKKIDDICKKYQFPQSQVRKPNMPEYLTENMIRLIIINYLGDKTCRKGEVGDLYSDIEGIQECKTFSSDGPISFGPTEKWDVIYFFDARDWLKDHFVLYQLKEKNDSPIFQHIKVNKKETFADQCNQQRRPRIGWDSLHPQIEQKIETVFNGNFEAIFKSPKSP